jgi:hypothetical protein
MSALYSNLIGGFGNQLFQYAAVRALAEKEGREFKTPEWVGEKIFVLPPVNRPQKGDMELRGYCQNQQSAIYTRSQVKEWFKIKPEIEQRLSDMVAKAPFVWHLRDYGDCPVLATVSTRSYGEAADKFGSDEYAWMLVRQIRPQHLSGFEQFDFLPDFYRLMKAEVLFRANSTFSMWAAWLGNGKVYSPVMEGKPGGQIVDVEFVEGNHPRCSSNCEFLTDIHLKP